MIKCDSEVPDTELKLKGVVSMLDGMRVVKVPANRLPAIGVILDLIL